MYIYITFLQNIFGKRRITVSCLKFQSLFSTKTRMNNVVLAAQEKSICEIGLRLLFQCLMLFQFLNHLSYGERCKLGVGVVNHILLHLYGHFITTACSKSNDKMVFILCFLSARHAYCRNPTVLCVYLVSGAPRTCDFLPSYRR